VRNRFSEIDDLAKKKEVPCIIGPDRQFYLIDHHHQSLAFLLNGNLKAYVNVIENWSRIQPEQFWPLMCSKNFCFSSLADGTTIDPRDSRFPHALNQCGDNPYRSLVWLLIKSKLIKEGTVPYFEFKVGEILSRHGLKIEGHPMHQNEWSSYLDESAHLLKKDSVQREIQAI